MRRFQLAAVAALGTLAVAVPVAIAADAQINTYTVSGKATGGKGATKKKPKAVAQTFSFQVGEEHGWRPSTITDYSIVFANRQVPNNTAFAGCDIKKINDPSGNGLADCPKGAIVGSGSIVNEVGPPSDPANKDLYCYLDLTLVNGTKKNQVLLWLEGGPKASTNPKKNCVQDTHEAIDAKFVKKSGGVAVQFHVPANLLHPAGGALDNGITDVTSGFKKLSTKKKGKTVGYFEATACTKADKLSVDFTQESTNTKTTATATTVCK
jgi:hypothetical protein